MAKALRSPIQIIPPPLPQGKAPVKRFTFWPVLVLALLFAPACLRDARQCANDAECFEGETCQAGSCLWQPSALRDAQVPLDMSVLLCDGGTMCEALEDMKRAADMGGPPEMGAPADMTQDGGMVCSKPIATGQVGKLGSNDVGFFNTLALDSKGYPHIAYRDATQGKLVYIRWDGCNWTEPHVFFNTFNAGYEISLVLDKNDKPHILSQIGTSGLVKEFLYLRNTEKDKWEKPFFPTLTQSPKLFRPSLALDAQDNAHVVYMANNGSARNLWYINNTEMNGTWSKPEEITAPNPTSFSFALGGENQDKVHVGYTSKDSAGNSTLFHVKKQITLWASVPVGTTMIAEQPLVLRLDQDHQPHAVYFYDGGLGKKLRYAFESTLNWNVDSSFLTIVYMDRLSFELDTGGAPHILYVGEDNYTYYINKMSTGQWSVPLRVKDADAYFSLALDSSNRPHVSYQKDGKLYFTYLEQGAWK